jgi:hypothetical protein
MPNRQNKTSGLNKSAIAVFAILAGIVVWILLSILPAKKAIESEIGEKDGGEKTDTLASQNNDSGDDEDAHQGKKSDFQFREFYTFEDQNEENESLQKQRPVQKTTTMSNISNVEEGATVKSTIVNINNSQLKNVSIAEPDKEPQEVHESEEDIQIKFSDLVMPQEKRKIKQQVLEDLNEMDYLPIGKPTR